MKLVDILARELKVWPDDGTDVVGQASDGCLHLNAACAPNRGFTEEAYKLASDWASSEVTRTEWQAAVDALNALKVVEPIIDWSTAPEGTTHFFECGSGSQWRKVSGADSYAWAREDWQLIAVPATITEYIARPEEQEAEIARMLDIINAAAAGGSGKAAARALYKAGYRNQVAP